MSMHHPWRAALALGAVATLALTACSSGGGDSEKADTSSDAPTGVTLTLWHNTADSEALLDLYKAYEDYSGNTIDLVDIPSDSFPMTTQQKWATGDRPDILEWHGNRTDALALNVAENTLDLSDLDFVSRAGSVADVSGNIDGATYAATLGPLSVAGVFYNKKVLADNGIAVPTSYADLEAACSTLQSGASGVTPLYETGGSGWPQMVLSGWAYMGEYNVDAAYADAVVDGTESLNDADGSFVAGLQQYVDLRDDGCFNADATTAKWEDGVKAVYDGSAAFIAQNTDSVALFDTAANGDTAAVDATIGFAPISATQPVASFAPSPLGTYYVPKTGDETKQRAALDFIEFATGEGYQDYVNEAGIIPTLSGVETPGLQQLWLDVQNSMDGAALMVNSAIPGFSVFGEETAALLAGQETPQQVGDNMQASFEQAQTAIGQ